MMEIAASSRPPLATLLAVALPLLLLAVVLLSRAESPARRRVLLGGPILGALMTAASAAFVSTRHAGTGTETARGWPRVLQAEWVSFEGGQARAGLQWRGLAENGLIYTAAATALLALGPALSRRSA